MKMHINEQRNLVLPIATEKVARKVDGKDVTEDVVKLWAYHTPISKEIFDAHFRVLAATKSALDGRGPHFLMSSAPRIAALTLFDEGRKDAIVRGAVNGEGHASDDDTKALVGEIKRLTTILSPGSNGWDMLPVDAAISSEKLDMEDWEEVLSSIVFFTCHYAMSRKADRTVTARAYASLLDASITSSTLSEYAASLPNSTSAEHTKRTPSSIPS